MLLARSYARRKRYEARILAQEVVGLLAEAMRGDESAAPTASAPAHHGKGPPTELPAKMKPSAMLAMMGVRISDD